MRYPQEMIVIFDLMIHNLYETMFPVNQEEIDAIPPHIRNEIQFQLNEY